MNVKAAVETIRAPRSEDAASIAALAASVERQLYGKSDATEADIRFIWGWPGLDLARDAWVATSNQVVIGYAFVWGPRKPESDYDSRLLLRLPDFPSDVGARLLDRMEARVLEKHREESAPSSPRLAIPCAALD